MAHTDIATQITRIQNGVSTQADLLTQIETALENKTSQSIALQEKIITPTASQQIILPDAGYDGLNQITVNGDSNLVPENIAKGVSIFGVSGSYEELNKQTCIINFSAYSNIIYSIHYTIFKQDGTLNTQYISNTSAQSYQSVSSVACNTLIAVVMYFSKSAYHVTCSDGLSCTWNAGQTGLYPILFKVPGSSGTYTATIS